MGQLIRDVLVRSGSKTGETLIQESRAHPEISTLDFLERFVKIEEIEPGGGFQYADRSDYL